MSRLEKLPDVLITYIYEYIPESYYKKMYNKSIQLINLRFNKEKILRYLSNKHELYNIYLSNYNPNYRIDNLYNLSSYILWQAKQWYDDKKMNYIVWNITPYRIKVN